MTRKKSVPFTAIAWIPQTQFLGFGPIKKGRRLVFTMTPVPFQRGDMNGVEYLIVVIEVDAKAGSVGAILTDHAHKDLGKAHSLDEALVSARAYAEAWVVHGGSIEACECAEIAARKYDISPIEDSSRRRNAKRARR